MGKNRAQLIAARIGSALGSLTAWAVTVLITGASIMSAMRDDWQASALWAIVLALFSIWGQLDMTRRVLLRSLSASSQQPEDR